MILMQLSGRRPEDGPLIFFGKDFDGVDVHPDTGEEGRKRNLGISTSRPKRKLGRDASAQLTALLSGDLAWLPLAHAVTAHQWQR